MKVMITGGRGFIGTYVDRIFKDNKHETFIYDLQDGYDITNSSSIDRFIQRNSPEVIVHLACKPIIDYCNKNTVETIDTIVGGTARLIDCAIKNGIKRFVFISSSMVYGDFEMIPVEEDASKNPKDVYGGAKLAAEEIVKSYSRKFGIDYVIIRPSAVYGPGDKGQRVSQKFIENAINGKPIVMNDGYNTKLDFTFVKDIAKGIYLATIHPSSSRQTFNITCGNGRSLFEYANLVKNKFPEIEILDTNQDTTIPKRGSLNITNAKNCFGYEPSYQLEEGIEIYIDHMNTVVHECA